MLDVETIDAHNSNKIKDLYETGEIQRKGAINFLAMICDLEEQAAQDIVSSWQIRDKTPPRCT